MACIVASRTPSTSAPGLSLTRTTGTLAAVNGFDGLVQDVVALPEAVGERELWHGRTPHP